MTEFIQVTTAIDSKDGAQKIAQTLEEISSHLHFHQPQVLS